MGNGMTWKETGRLAESSRSLVYTAPLSTGRATWKIVCSVLVASDRKPTT